MPGTNYTRTWRARQRVSLWGAGPGLTVLALAACVLAPTEASCDWLELAGVLKTVTPPNKPAPASLSAELKSIPLDKIFLFTDPHGSTEPNPAPSLAPVMPLIPQTLQTSQTAGTTLDSRKLLSFDQGNASQNGTNPQGQKVVSNVFAGTDIREAFSEIASAAGVTVIPDETIKQTLVYMEFRNEPIDSAIQKLALLSGAYVKKKPDGVYLVSQATPEAGLFREFAETATYRPQNETAATLSSLMNKSYTPYVQKDDKSNLITVTAPSELLPKILGDLRQADAPLRQFVVEALVTEIAQNNEKDFGFSWSWKHFAQGSDLSLTYTQALPSDIATLKALIGEGKATLRANPRLTAFEGRQSTMLIGQETYFSILTGNINFPTAQIQLIKTGVTLTFTGFISDDGTITLDLAPDVSDAIVSVNGNPTTNVRRASTMVRVKSGETIAIGGLIQESTSKTVNRIPILGYIPIIGQLFTQSTSNTKRTEDIILITPYLTDQGAGSKGVDSSRAVPPPNEPPPPIGLPQP